MDSRLNDINQQIRLTQMETDISEIKVSSDVFRSCLYHAYLTS